MTLDKDLRTSLRAYIHNIIEDNPINENAMGMVDIFSNSGLKERFLGLDNLIKILASVKSNTLIIISDLPFELGDKRHIISRVLNKRRKDIRILTSDVGLKVSLNKKIKVLCEFSNKLVDVEDIDEESIEGYYWGMVRHFQKRYRLDENFQKFLEVPI
ncbi:MAG: hypothetical protein KAW88_07885 [Candidatus Cloacimonetes bacterium]|nr:hypothetical protein [Candidatus Cloacimonadota bacterium]